MPLLLLIACTTSELSESWEIDRLRILAVAAEPAEPRPGDTVTFSSLVVSPDGPVAATVWFACLGEGYEDFGCDIDPALLEGMDSGEISAEDLEALYAAGFIGANPFLPPVWNVPTDALDGLSPEERLEGRTAIVNVTAIPEGENLDDDDLELAFKRVPVSEATTPNHNPVIASVTVDGVEVPPGTTVSVDRGQPYTVGISLTDDSVEPYVYVGADGTAEDREEEPYLSWYTREGSFDRTFDLWPYNDAIWYAPEAPAEETGGIWVVVRDRRGGMAWAALPVRYR